MTWVLVAIVIVPLVVAVAIAVGPTRAAAIRVAPLAAIPALLVALAAPAHEVESIPWLLLDSWIGLDRAGQLFLLFTGILWTVAGLYARSYHARDPRRASFFVAFLFTLSGNLGLIVAHDAATFYTAFAVMTFSAYPLVLHAADAEAIRAGRVYIALAVLGESMLIAGLILASITAASLSVTDMAAGVASSPHRDLAVGLLLAGFGVKAGALPLHVWLPLAHPIAPTAASAVLSGCMIKAGLLGWIRFLPLGEVALPGWGALVIALGLAAAFFGVVIGVTQTDPKTALAYSSISQMGLINVAIGIGLGRPEGWSFALAACLTYAVHHGLAKGALFLGVGVAAAAGSHRVARRLTLAGLAFAALTLAGAPLTSGSVAKSYLKEVTPLSPAAWPHLLDWLLPLSAVATTLLMTRFLWLVSRPVSGRSHPTLDLGLWLPWTMLLAAVAGALWLLPHAYELEIDPPGLPYPGAIWVSIWPVMAGGMLAWAAVFAARRGRLETSRIRVSAGDLLVLLEWGLGRLPKRLRRQTDHAPADPVISLASRWYGIYARGEGRSVVRLEQRLTGWSAAGTLAVALTILLLLLLSVR
jgi:formate hydrogenlyase subunit 3/multisubunit Na+/H+ antiporter MnhD subunit